MDGVREGLLGVLCISKCNIVEIPLAFPFSSVCHKVLPSSNDHLSDFCPSQAVLFRGAGGCSPGFRVLCLTMRFPTTKSEALAWGVAVILGEKGYWNVWGSHNWRWEISFCTEKILIFSKPKWKCLFLCQSWVGAAEKPEPKWLDFFPLCSAATEIWKKRVIGSGENRQWVYSCAQPAANPQILKMKHEKTDLQVCDCSVQCVVPGSHARGVRPLSTWRSPIFTASK